MSSPTGKCFSISLINLNNGRNHTYNPGDRIVGTMEINGQNLTAFNQFSIKLNLVGLSYVKWDTFEITRTEHEFMRIVKKWTRKMPANTIEILFEFDLPANALPSFELRYGFINYSIQANFTAHSPNPHIGRLQVCEVLGFAVNNCIDLNAYPALRAPGQIIGERTFYCGPCISSPLKVDFKIARRGYLAGETIVCEIVVKNYTTKDVTSMNVDLVFVSGFTMRRNGFGLLNKTHGSVKDSRRFDNKIPSLSNVKWSNVSLTIPQSLPPTNVHSKNIYTGVNVELTLNIEGRQPSKYKIPILIGTKGFTEIKQTNPTNSSTSNESEQFHDSNEEFEIVSTSNV